ncbi:MAG: CRISPR-associated protein Cas4 [Candidatus Promineifilaceae bacterium]
MSTSVIALSVALALIIVVIWLIYELQQSRYQASMSQGELVYADEGVLHKQTESLTAMDVGLVGRPDYIMRFRDGSLVPIELKSGHAPRGGAYNAHIMQLMAYCLLVQENYGIRPIFGRLQYEDTHFDYEYTDELEDELLDILAYMREDMFEQDVTRDHENSRKCANCSVRDFCEQRLA